MTGPGRGASSFFYSSAYGPYRYMYTPLAFASLPLHYWCNSVPSGGRHLLKLTLTCQKWEDLGTAGGCRAPAGPCSSSQWPRCLSIFWMRMGMPSGLDQLCSNSRSRSTGKLRPILHFLKNLWNYFNLVTFRALITVPKDLNFWYLLSTSCHLNILWSIADTVGLSAPGQDNVISILITVKVF